MISKWLLGPAHWSNKSFGLYLGQKKSCEVITVSSLSLDNTNTKPLHSDEVLKILAKESSLMLFRSMVAFQDLDNRKGSSSGKHALKTNLFVPCSEGRRVPLLLKGREVFLTVKTKVLPWASFCQDR